MSIMGPIYRLIAIAIGAIALYGVITPPMVSGHDDLYVTIGILLMVLAAPVILYMAVKQVKQITNQTKNK